MTSQQKYVSGVSGNMPEQTAKQYVSRNPFTTWTRKCLLIMCVPTCVKYVRLPHDNTLEPIHCMAALAPTEKTFATPRLLKSESVGKACTCRNVSSMSDFPATMPWNRSSWCSFCTYGTKPSQSKIQNLAKAPCKHWSDQSVIDWNERRGVCATSAPGW